MKSTINDLDSRHYPLFETDVARSKYNMVILFKKV